MGKTTTTNTNSAPPQWLQGSLQDFLGQAQGLIGSNTDPNSLVAGFNKQQKQAFGNIDNLANGQFNQKDIDKYMSPYQDDVINATQKQLDLNDAQQQTQLQGNIASQGALGGDRAAVVQSQLAGQQDTANNATIAGLENQGYDTALNAYETANQQQLGAAEAQLGAGTMQQQNAQQVIDAPYQQLDFLGNLYGNLGGLFGGTSQTKQTTPFSLADGGRAGRFDDGGVTRNIMMPFGGSDEEGGHGGRATLTIPAAPVTPKGPGLTSSLQQMGDINSTLKNLGVNTGMGSMPGSPPGLPGSSSGPSGGGSGGGGAPPGGAGLMGAGAGPSAAPSVAVPGASAAPAAAGAGDAAAGIGAAGEGAAGAGAAGAGLGAAGAAGGAAAGAGAAGAAAAGTAAAAAGTAAAAGGAEAAASMAALAVLAAKDGGTIRANRPLGVGLQGPKRLDDGGDVSDLADTTVVDENGQLIPAGASAMTADQTPDSWRGLATHYAPPASAPAPQTTPPAQGTAGLTAASGPNSPTTNPTWSNGEPVVQSKGLGDADAANVPTGTKPGYYNAPADKPSPWLSIATGVLGALANRSLSKGALMGLQEYHNEELEQNPTVDHSGTTVQVCYHGPNGHCVDTGIPTEAAMNAKAMNDYRLDSLQERKDALASENSRAGATLAQSRQVHIDSEADRRNNLNIARINAGLEPLPDASPATSSPSTTGAPAGTPDLFGAFATKMQAAENSTGNPSAQPIDPKTGKVLSSAVGNGQFIQQTWLDMLKSVNPQIASSLTPQQQLALRSDPAFSNEMTIAYAKQNGQKLAAAGQPVTTSSLALAHRFGPQGAVSIMNAPPTAPLASILPPAVIKANPNLAHQTAGQYAQAVSQQFGNAPVSGQQSATAQTSFIPPKFLSEPQLIAGTDAKGAPQRVLAQQDKRNGQWITADQNRTPVNLSDMQIIPGGGAGGQGNRAEVYFNRVVNAGNEVAAAARNIMELPSISSTGLFGGRSQGPGLFDAAKENLTNTLSTQDTQAYNTMIAGVTRGLAAIESAGLAPSGTLMHSMDSVVLKDGDTVETKMRKMAEMRQIVEKGLEPNLSNPKIPPEQKQLVQGIIDQIGKAIPFTQHDITMLDQAKNPQTTLAQVAAQRSLGNSKQSAAGGHFQEGQVYKDKNGNRAVYNNGHWTPAP